jgi:malate dehydrogenase (oxaloacetate-decarboxylating)
MAIGRAGGDIGAIDIVNVGNDYIIRDITVSSALNCAWRTDRSGREDSRRSRTRQCFDPTFLMHLGGKIEVVSKVPLKTRADLSMAYTPGVARICEAIHKDPEKAFTLTIKKNKVASRYGWYCRSWSRRHWPAAAMPVMEGKAMLFKEFAGVDAFPICLSTKDPDEIVRTVKAVSTAFGGNQPGRYFGASLFRD